jgi:hypothetical protein
VCLRAHAKASGDEVSAGDHDRAGNRVEEEVVPGGDMTSSITAG